MNTNDAIKILKENGLNVVEVNFQITAHFVLISLNQA